MHTSPLKVISIYKAKTVKCKEKKHFFDTKSPSAIEMCGYYAYPEDDPLGFFLETFLAL